MFEWSMNFSFSNDWGKWQERVTVASIPNLKFNWCNFTFVESCVPLWEGRVCEFLATRGDEWYLASCFLGWGRAEQAKPPINTLGCGPFIDTHMFHRPLMHSIFFLEHWWIFFFQTITLYHPYDGLWHVSVLSGSIFAWRGAVDSWLRDQMFLCGWIAGTPSTLSCWWLFQLTIKPVLHRWALTPTYSINHRRPPLSYFLHPGQQNTLHVVLKLSSDH